MLGAVAFCFVVWLGCTVGSVHHARDGVKMRCYHTEESSCERSVFTVLAPRAGLFDVVVRAGKPLESYARLTANGAWHQEISPEGPSGRVPLNGGTNTLEVAHPRGGLEGIEVLGGVGWASLGAALPFVEIEAENGTTNAPLIGPDYTFTRLPSEASQRLAVQLRDPGHYLEFSLPSPTNALSLRYSIPDSPQGGGQETLLSVYLNGRKFRDVTLTSAYSWYYGTYPFTKNPSDGKPHHFYDEANFWLDGTYPVGTKVRLEGASGRALRSGDCQGSDGEKRDCGFFGIDQQQCLDRNCCWKPNPPPNPGHVPDCFYPIPPSPPAPTPTPSPPPSFLPITIDLVDFYLVGPATPQPPNSLSILDMGADPSGQKDSTQAIGNAITKARGSGLTVWVPPGTFTVTDHLLVDSVTIIGAGPWYSQLHGNRVGIFGLPIGSANVQVHGLSILGEVKIRNDADPVNGVGGALSNSVFSNIWIQHTKCGFWLDGPFENLLISGAFVRDTTADGVNFHRGVTDSVVEQSVLRNVGDDGLAMWSESLPDQRNTFRFNTLYTPVLANHIALYGGTNNSILNNLLMDSVTQGGGLHVGNRFNAQPLGGTTTIAGNFVRRAGCLDPNWNFGIGALWFYALDSEMDGRIEVRGNMIEDSPYEAIQFIGRGVKNVVLDGVSVKGVGSFVFQFQCDGSAEVSGVVASGVGLYGQYNCGVQFVLSYGSGNEGWNTTHCGWLEEFIEPLN